MADDTDDPRDGGGEGEGEGAEKPRTGLDQVVDWIERLEQNVPQILEAYLGGQRDGEGGFDAAGFPSERLKEGAQAVVDAVVKGGTKLAEAATSVIDVDPILDDDDGREDPVADVRPEPAAAPEEADEDGGEEGEAGKVIDLATERRKRQPPVQNLIEDLGKSLRETFQRYVDDRVVDEGASGDVEVKVDAEFLKEHAGALAGELLGALTKAFSPPKEPGEATAEAEAEPEPEPEPEPELEAAGEAEATEAGPRQVNVSFNLDLAGLLGSIFKPVEPPEDPDGDGDSGGPLEPDEPPAPESPGE